MGVSRDRGRSSPREPRVEARGVIRMADSRVPVLCPSLSYLARQIAGRSSTSEGWRRDVREYSKPSPPAVGARWPSSTFATTERWTSQPRYIGRTEN